MTDNEERKIEESKDSPFYFDTNKIVPFKKITKYSELIPGSTLKNGALLLGYRESDRGNIIVLAADEKFHFVTWLLNSECNTYSGKYYEHIEDAVDNFRERL